MSEDPHRNDSPGKAAVLENGSMDNSIDTQTTPSTSKNQTPRSKRRTRNTPIFSSRFVPRSSAHVTDVATPPISPIESVSDPARSGNSLASLPTGVSPNIKPVDSRSASTSIPIQLPESHKPTPESPPKSPAKSNGSTSKDPNCTSGSVPILPARRLRSRPVSPENCEPIYSPRKRTSPRKIFPKDPVSPYQRSPKKLISPPKKEVSPKIPATSTVNQPSIASSSSSLTSPSSSPPLAKRKRSKTNSSKKNTQCLGSPSTKQAPTKPTRVAVTTSTVKCRPINLDLALNSPPTRPNKSGKTLPGLSGVPNIGISAFDKNLILDLSPLFLNHPRSPFPNHLRRPPLHLGCCGRPVDPSRAPIFDNLGCFVLGAYFRHNCHFFHVSNVHNWISLYVAQTRLANFYKLFRDAVDSQEWMLDHKPWDFVCHYKAESLFDNTLQSASWAHFKRVFPRSFVASPEELARYCASPHNVPQIPARTYYRFEHDDLIIAREISPNLGINEDFEESFSPPAKFPTEMYQVGVLLCF